MTYSHDYSKGHNYYEEVFWNLDVGNYGYCNACLVQF